MVAVWRAGSERKADMNDSQWSAVKNQQRDPTVVLKKGEAGFKEWDDLRNWLKLTGWVDVEWEDEEGDPRAPDEDAIADAAEVKQLRTPADALAAAALGAPTSGDGRAPRARAGEGSERSRSPSLPPRQRRHAPRRGGGRRSYNLEGLGFCVEVCVEEQYISDNGLEVRKGKAYKCAFCEKTLAALRDGVPTTKMQDHLAKCDNLPADKVPELNEATGGTFQRRRANSTRGRRSTQTVVMQPLVPQGSVGGTAQQDNVGYMRSTLNELELMFPNLICIGCVVHVLDLLCEDYAKLLMEYVNMANKIVVFVTGHDRVCQLFLRLKGPQGTGLRTFPDTGFSYASLMLSSVLTNKRTLRDMPDDPAWEDVSTHKDGSPMADREWFVDSIEERRIFLKFSCALALLQPVTDAIRFMEALFRKFCSSESEVTQCVNEFMKFHNGDGGYRMMKEFAEQAHEQEFQSMKEKYLQDNSLGSLPSEVVKAILYCQASMACGNCPITWWKTMGKTLTNSVDEEMRSMIEDMLVQEVAAADMEAATSSNNATDDGQQGQQGDGGDQDNGQPGEAGAIVLEGATV
eukprot:jgi/Tetstr1/459109/TSEL_004559.t1